MKLQKIDTWYRVFECCSVRY